MNNEELIKRHEKMIWKITNSFYNVDKNDLFQAGVVGLIKAYKNYKRDGNTKFSSYAYDYIFGEMYLLSNNRNIKISKDILKLYRKIEETRYMLAQKLNRIPNNYEISSFLKIDHNMVDLACSSGNAIISLDQENDDDKNIYDVVGKFEDIDTKILIDDSFKVLTDI